MGNELEFKIKLTPELVKSFMTNDKIWNENDLYIDEIMVKKDSYYKSPYVPLKTGNIVRIRNEYSCGKYNDISFLTDNITDEELEKISSECKESFICFKEKSVIDGCEITKEFESINQEHVGEKIIEALGGKEYFSKEKKSISFNFFYDPNRGNFNIELVCVNKQYYYLEIEWVGDFTEELSDSEKVFKYLENIVTKLGFDSSNKDPRSWMEIINGDNLKREVEQHFLDENAKCEVKEIDRENDNSNIIKMAQNLNK